MRDSGSGARWTSVRGLPQRILTGLGLLTLIGATVYGLTVRPWVEEALVGESRLRVAVLGPDQFVPRGLPHTGMWLYPDGAVEPSELPAGLRDPYDNSAERAAWAVDHGAVAAETLALRLSVRARDDTPVILHGLRVDIVRRDAPLGGWFLVPDAGCGGQLVRSVDVDLDEDPVVPMLAPRQGEPRPFDVTLRVSDTDPEVYEIHAQTFSHHVEFRLVLLYDSETGVGEYVVDNDGAPFAVSALMRGKARAYDLPYSEDAQPSSLQRAPERDPTEGGVGFC
jgi:hypothetical protein